MTKNGNRSLRTLVIHGARSVMRCVKKRDDSLGQLMRAVSIYQFRWQTNRPSKPWFHFP
ncbi:hypothetical protein [Serratia proteamaculans]|uniref:hypothetical protein n=1 Tax=Serratia proteamaculans TaxID=28151 RepID=UPI001F5CD409|nr:hypothetical protein [Serratia proteamaculans]